MPLPPRLSIILKGYPRLSETFIAQELLGLQERGVAFEIISLRHPTDKQRHPIHSQITAPVRYLPEYLYQEPRRVLTAWWHLRRRPHYRMARNNWLADLRRDFTANRIRRFGQALVLAHELSPQTRWLYAHFLHTPASVTQYAAQLSDLPWSCSAHAKDIWTSPDWDLIGKLKTMQWLVTCTKHNVTHLRGLSRDHADKVSLLYHGLDLRRFDAAPKTYSTNDGNAPEQPVTILSVGRAVEKKGYNILLHALQLLPGKLHWRFIHIGGGAKLGELQALAASLGIDGRITWLGARAQTEVLQHYRQADLFALTSLIAQDGDRDGLPNVLMEAQTQGLSCLSTAVSAIPELIIDGQTGLLVPPQNVEATSRALEKLITDAKLRQRLGAAGQAHMHKHFSHDLGIDELAKRFADVCSNTPTAEEGAKTTTATKPKRTSATIDDSVT